MPLGLLATAWLVPSVTLGVFIAGYLFGVATMALMVAARRGDDMAQADEARRN